jgi:hypothetical protein
VAESEATLTESSTEATLTALDSDLEAALTVAESEATLTESSTEATITTLELDLEATLTALELDEILTDEKRIDELKLKLNHLRIPLR